MFNELKKEMKETKNKCKATLTSSAFYRIQWMNLIYFIKHLAKIVCHLVKSFTSYCCVWFVYFIWQKQIPNIQTVDDIPIEFIFTFLSNLVTFLLSTFAIHLFWKRARNHLAIIADYREKREADSIPKRIQDQVILSDYAKQLFVPVGLKKVEHELETQPAYIEGQSAHTHIEKYLEETFVIVKLKWSIIEPKSLSVQECVLETDSSFTLEEASE